MRGKIFFWFITVLFFVNACDDGDDSPSKGKLVFIKRNQKPGLYTMDFEGDHLKRVAGEGNEVYWPGNPYGGHTYIISTSTRMSSLTWS